MKGREFDPRMAARLHATADRNTNVQFLARSHADGDHQPHAGFLVWQWIV